MAEIERVKVCQQCRSEFRERANYGRLLCRIHPDTTPTDSFMRMRCCGNRPCDGWTVYSDTVTSADAAGCLRCDHSANVPVTMERATVLPCLLVESQLVMPPMASQIVARIDGSVLRECMAQGKPIITVHMPAPLAPSTLNVVTCALQVLKAFVQSPYYDWTQCEGIRDARSRFETHSKRYLVTMAWDAERDRHPDYEAFVNNADDDEEEGKALEEDFYAPADRLALDSPATRLAIIQTIRQRNDTKTLCDMAVPFYIIQRIAPEKDRETLLHFNYHNEAETAHLDPAMRNTRFSNVSEYTPPTTTGM